MVTVYIDTLPYSQSTEGMLRLQPSIENRPTAFLFQRCLHMRKAFLSRPSMALLKHQGDGEKTTFDKRSLRVKRVIQIKDWDHGCRCLT